MNKKMSFDYRQDKKKGQKSPGDVTITQLRHPQGNSAAETEKAVDFCLHSSFEFHTCNLVSLRRQEENVDVDLVREQFLQLYPRIFVKQQSSDANVSVSSSAVKRNVRSAEVNPAMPNISSAFASRLSKLAVEKLIIFLQFHVS